MGSDSISCLYEDFFDLLCDPDEANLHSAHRKLTPFQTKSQDMGVEGQRRIERLLGGLRSPFSRRLRECG